MKVYPDKLAAHLAGELATIYMVAGDEPLQVEESLAAIRDAAAQAGYTERERYFVERGFDWNAFLGSAASMSLFASRRIIEIRLPTGKPGDAGAKALKEFCTTPPEDTLLLVGSTKVDQRASWVKAIEKAGVLVNAWPVEMKRLPQWIQSRLRSRGLRVDREAAQLLAERVEGNLLAAAQEIEKLVLLHGEGDVDFDAVQRSVANSARYDVFGLVDSALLGARARTVRTLEGLRGEGVEPVLILWAVAREVRDLAKRSASGRGGTPNMAGVWDKRRDAVSRALGRHPREHWTRFLVQAAHVDRVSKGLAGGDAWQEMTRLLLAIAGPGTATRARN